AGQGREHLVGVLVGLHLAEDPGDVAVGVDHERRALDAHVLLARELLLDPDAVLLGDGVVLVCEERERQLVLLPEPDVRAGAVRADAEDRRPSSLELAPGVADRAGLDRAARRVVFGIKIQYYRSTLQGGQRE